MARTIPSSLTSIVSAQANKPLELYEVYLDNQTLYYAQAEDPVVFGTNTYTSIGLTRSPVHTTAELQVDEVIIKLDNVTLDVTKAIVTKDYIGRRLVIRKVFRENLSSSSLSIIVFDGRMDEPILNQNDLSIHVRSWLDALQNYVPRRVYSTLCNYQIYDADCTVNQFVAANIVSGTATSSSTSAILQSTAITPGTKDYWTIGTLVMLTGSLANIGRGVLSSSGTTATVRVPYDTSILAGDTFSLRRGCTKTVADCNSKFGNYINFGGFPVTPKTPIV